MKSLPSFPSHPYYIHSRKNLKKTPKPINSTPNSDDEIETLKLEEFPFLGTRNCCIWRGREKSCSINGQKALTQLTDVIVVC